MTCSKSPSIIWTQICVSSSSVKPLSCLTPRLGASQKTFRKTRSFTSPFKYRSSSQRCRHQQGVSLLVSSLGAILTARKESVPNTNRLNGARADKQLRDMPANDPIYQAQSNALASYHWMKNFQSMPDYLKDQETDQAEKEILINKKADTLIAFLKSETEDLKIVNPDYDKQLQAQVDSIGQLRAWAIKKKHTGQPQHPPNPTLHRQNATNTRRRSRFPRLSPWPQP
jgi:hypothetical protein